MDTESERTLIGLNQAKGCRSFVGVPFRRTKSKKWFYFGEICQILIGYIYIRIPTGPAEWITHRLNIVNLKFWFSIGPNTPRKYKNVCWYSTWQTMPSIFKYQYTIFEEISTHIFGMAKCKFHTVDASWINEIATRIFTSSQWQIFKNSVSG